MNSAEHNPADDWFVRVLGKDYGPVDLDTLREWKAEGRLIADNEVRRSAEETWARAGTVAELFGPPPLPSRSAPAAAPQTRGLGRIISDSFAVYLRGFRVFIVLALLVGIPSFLMKLTLAFIQVRPESGFAGTPPAAIAAAIFLLPLLVAGWLIFISGLQFATADVAAGQIPRFGEVMRQVGQSWTRVARAGAFVYGSYIFWTALPLLAILTIAGGQPSVASLFIALAALALQVYMAGRLFINFMFWQQACTIGELDAPEALRESKEVARSQPSAPRLQRPLYRGAILASLWLLALLVCSAAVELPFVMVRMQGITNFEELRALMEQLSNAPAPDRITVITYALSSLVHAVLRPLLGISFVLLYFDAKARLR